MFVAVAGTTRSDRGSISRRVDRLDRLRAVRLMIRLTPCSRSGNAMMGLLVGTGANSACE